MEEEKCEICGRYALLKEAIVDGSQIKICPLCVVSHDAIVIEKPTDEQIANIHRPIYAKEIQKMREEARKRERAWNFGRIVKEAREKSGMTQKELAEAVAEPEKTISRLEMGYPQSEGLIVKLKQFLRTRLRRPSEIPDETEEKQGLDFKSKELKISDIKKLEDEKK